MSERARKLWAWFFGVIAPPILFKLDSVSYGFVLRRDIGGEEGGRIAGDWAIPIYVSVGACSLAAAIALAVGPRRSAVHWICAPLLLYGAVVGLIVAVLLLPLSVIGLTVGVGVLGLIPFVTCTFYIGTWLQCCRAYGWRMSVASVVLAMLMGLAAMTGRLWTQYERESRVEPLVNRRVSFHQGETGNVRVECKDGTLSVSDGPRELWNRKIAGVRGLVSNDRVVVVIDFNNTVVLEARTGTEISSRSHGHPNLGYLTLGPAVYPDSIVGTFPLDWSSRHPVAVLEFPFEGGFRVLFTRVYDAQAIQGSDGERLLLVQNGGAAIMYEITDRSVSLGGFVHWLFGNS